MATPVPFTINPNAFAKCAPAISTNIKQCGSVTQCNAKAMTSQELDVAYMRSNEFRVMEALFHHDMEIKMCEAVQNGLYDFMMANKVNLSRKQNTRRLSSGLIEIAPFIMMRQYSPINNAYWLAYDGHLDTGMWVVNVRSTTNIPADVRSFPAQMRVFIQGKSPGGSRTETAYEVIQATLVADHVTLVLRPQNSASHLPPDKLGNPIQGILRRGTPNINDYEKWCNEQPAYLNWKNVPSWTETHRTSMCKSELYDKWRKLVLEDNALYREFFDLDEIEKNRQLGADWQKRFVEAMFWNKPLPFQNAAEYDQLDDIETFDMLPEGPPGLFDIGADAGRCVGKRANAVGIYEQMAECGRVVDLQGAVLNLPALFVELYNMMRVREGRNHPNPREFDLFTDTVTAELINQAMLAYYKAKGQDMVRLNIDANGFNVAKKADFGFYFKRYPLFWPQGVILNVVTHYFFDDYLTAAQMAFPGDNAIGRVLWILDFTGIYPGILSSSRVVLKTGNLNTLAEISEDFACVMKVPTKTQTLYSVQWTMIVECPMANLIIENIAGQAPTHDGNPVGDYGNTATSTTTTTAHVYGNAEQSYTASCPQGTTGTPVTVTVPADSYGSTVSQSDANAQALAAATAEAAAQLQCVGDEGVTDQQPIN